MDEIYNVKIATQADIAKYYDSRIKNEPENSFLPFQKEKRLHSEKNKTALFFYGYLNGEMICQASAAVSVDDLYVQNKEHIMTNNCAYLFNFLTREDCRKKGYFSKLYAYMEDVLKNFGLEYLCLGVEPDDTVNKQIYSRYGFNELIYEGYEQFDGIKIDVQYFRKKLVTMK